MLNYPRLRVQALIAKGGLGRYRSVLPRVPLTLDEVREAVKIRYETDGLKVIHMLEKNGSQLGSIFHSLGLTRDTIQQALDALDDCRQEQTMLCGILCATRFKIARRGELYSTRCARCGSRDTFWHMAECAGLTVPIPSTDPFPLVLFLKQLA